LTWLGRTRIATPGRAGALIQDHRAGGRSAEAQQPLEHGPAIAPPGQRFHERIESLVVQDTLLSYAGMNVGVEIELIGNGGSIESRCA
jgi:hypothetical protein